MADFLVFCIEIFKETPVVCLSGFINPSVLGGIKGYFMKINLFRDDNN